MPTSQLGCTRASFFPATTPGAPVIGIASSGKVGLPVTATGRWTPPASNGGSVITGYLVNAQQINAAGVVVNTVTSTVQPATARELVMTLPAGNYRFTVQAMNAVGTGATSARSLNLVTAR